MTRSSVVLRLSLAILATGSIQASSLIAQEPVVSAQSRADDDALFTTEELDNLLAPIALYPDPILAEFFIAATYPEQVALAHRYVDEYGTDDVDNQGWDRSVKAIARYPAVLNMLYERPNWATAIGRAYAMQSGDVMASVQSLRRMARAQGNLVSTDQQRVYVEREYIRIVPAQARVIYVPVYDPYVVYYRPIDYVRVVTPYWSFGVGYPIGPWLGYDCDWDTRVVYYHGWSTYGRSGWWAVSRPYMGYNPYWMGPRISVVVNLGVRHRYVNYGGFGYYNTVHRNTSWDRSRMPGRGRFDNHVSKQPAPDRYGIPSRRDSYVGRTAKDNVGPVVPRAGGSRPSAGTTAGTGSRPSGGRGNGGDRGNAGNNGNGGDRANGGGRGNGGNSGVREDRVTPVRIGGNRRPLYPGNEDISTDRARGSVPARREASTDNGSWNPRGEVKREESRGRDADPVRAPRSSGERIAPSRGANESGSTPRYEPRSAPRTETRSAPRSYETPRSAPRAERSVEPRSAPRMSSPRASAPRESAPRASAPRASAPQRESAPRASAPRSSGSRGSSGEAPRARGKRDPN